MVKRLGPMGWLLVGVLCAGGCAMPSAEPRNLDFAKADMATYVDSGRYLTDVSAVAEDAGAYIEKRAAHRKPGERLAIVFDIDETALSNVAHIRSVGWGYITSDWAAWIDSAQAPALEPVLLLFRAAQHAGVETVFITGRMEQRDGPGTIRNLRTAGYTGYSWLIFQPDTSAEPTGVFKLLTRDKLQREGFTIIANIGDQDSDLAGGSSEKNFKLPGPFYHVD